MRTEGVEERREEESRREREEQSRSGPTAIHTGFECSHEFVAGICTGFYMVTLKTHAFSNR